MKSLLNILRGIGRFLKVGAVIGLFFLTVAIGGLIAVYLTFSGDLPNIQAVSDYRPQIVSTVYGSDGTQIGEFWSDEKRILADLKEMPPLLIGAFIAAEDSRFFEHRGVDFRGTLRAFTVNLKSGDIVQGGSTITQQVTRSLLLSRQKTYSRKIKEAILATRLERFLTKDQILYLYLNQIFFGNRSYGVKAAVQNYFHKDLNEVNLAEISLLAGLPRSPLSHSPLRHPEKARERQMYVLRRLLEEGAISEKELDGALKTEIKLYVQGTDKESNLALAPHFLEYLRKILLEKYGEETLYFGGLKIHTTIDPKMQKAANVAITRGLEIVDRRTRSWRGKLDHVDPSGIKEARQKLHQEIVKQQNQRWHVFPPGERKETPIEEGEIFKAIVTGFQEEETLAAVGTKEITIPKKDVSFDQTKLAYDENLYMHQPSRQLKMGDIIQVRALPEGRFAFYQTPQIEGALFSQETATGHVRAMVGGYDFKKSEFNRAMDATRQPGSAFKIFVYAAALDKGYTMGSAIADSPFSIPVGDEVWAPKNYDEEYRGVTTVHNALVYSYNVATARIGYHIRLHYLTAYARKLGLTTPIFKYPSMTLGANGVHLHEMVSAVATFPNLGVYRPPIFVTKIVDKNGNILEETLPPPPAEMIEDKKNEDLNLPLYEANQTHIKEDELNLFPSELKVLYGNNIPPGRVMTPQTAYLIVQLMQDVVKMGTGMRVSKLGKPVAGKTGTSNEESDTWFIGTVPDLACGVWVGYDQVRRIGKGEQGGRTAAPIFLDFMQEATKNWQPKDFPMPPEVNGQNLFALTGGSAKFAEYVPLSAVGFIEGGSSEDRASDFMEADSEGGGLSESPPPEERKNLEEGF